MAASCQLPRPPGREDRPSSPSGDRCLWKACSGRQLPSARPQQLGGRGHLPRWRLVSMGDLRGRAVANGPRPLAGGHGFLPRWRSVALEGLRGTAVPNGPVPPAGGMRSPAKVAVVPKDGL